MAEVPPRSRRPPPAPVHEEPGAGRLPDDLGFSDLVFPPRDDRAPVDFVGGERVALAWVTTYVSKFLERYYVGATNTMRKGKSAIGRDATTKFRRGSRTGAISARRIYHLVEKLERQRSASDATGWLKHELVWRDYLRFAGWPRCGATRSSSATASAARCRASSGCATARWRRSGSSGGSRAHRVPLRRRLHAGARGDGVHDALRARVRLLVFSARPRRRLAARRRLL